MVNFNLNQCIDAGRSSINHQLCLKITLFWSLFFGCKKKLHVLTVKFVHIFKQSFWSTRDKLKNAHGHKKTKGKINNFRLTT